MKSHTYLLDDGREFNFLKYVNPPINELIMVHTFDNEVLSVKAKEAGLGVEFYGESDDFILEFFEVKGWSFWK